ncbi:hypothetical protein BY458DRAFT_513540 [Sporodiniella umbellata]|nr:hypothetical protein BY458DRAFT_513540 [Sporodiniella umbellata]
MKSYDPYPRNISANDKAFIDLCRCLYQAKAVVRDLESFSLTLSPALDQYPSFPCHDKSHVYRTAEKEVLLKQANRYLKTTFQKFTRLCKLLLMILTKMESASTGQVKRERIDSFRAEIWQEWKTATDLKQKTLHLIQANSHEPKSTLDYTTSPSSNSATSTPTTPTTNFSFASTKAATSEL